MQLKMFPTCDIFIHSKQYVPIDVIAFQDNSNVYCDDRDAGSVDTRWPTNAEEWNFEEKKILNE